MKTGKVKVTDLSGGGNKIFHSGDKVTEEHFPPGNFDKLVEHGFIDLDEEISDENVEGNALKHVITEADLKNNPELADQGVKVNDEIEIPEGYRVSKKGLLTRVKK